MTTYSPETPTETEARTLRRCPHHRMVAGVAAGIADYMDVDVATVRIVAVLLALFGGIGIPLYAAAWIFLPEEGTDTSIGDELAERIGLH